MKAQESALLPLGDELSQKNRGGREGERHGSLRPAGRHNPLQQLPLFLPTSLHFTIQKTNECPRQGQQTPPTSLLRLFPTNATSGDKDKRSYFVPGAAKFNFVSIGSELCSSKSDVPNANFY